DAQEARQRHGMYPFTTPPQAEVKENSSRWPQAEVKASFLCDQSPAVGAGSWRLVQLLTSIRSDGLICHVPDSVPVAAVTAIVLSAVWCYERPWTFTTPRSRS